MKKLIKKILDALYPEGITCNLCGKELTDRDDRHLSFCTSCLGEFLPCKEEQRIDDCDVFSLYTYESVRELILHCKDDDRPYLATSIGRLLAGYYLKNDISADVVTYVPASPKNKKKRGYDHMKYIAEEFSRQTGLPVDHGLIHVVNNFDQTAVSASDRYKNVSSAFEYRSMALKDKTVLLLDDLVTTGATLSACISALKISFPTKIICLTFGKAGN